MLVEVEMENGTNSAGLFMHKLLSDSVGHSIAAFAACAPPPPLATYIPPLVRTASPV